MVSVPSLLETAMVVIRNWDYDFTRKIQNSQPRSRDFVITALSHLLFGSEAKD